MERKYRVLRWLIVILLLGSIVFLSWNVRGVFLPFFLALAVAYVLEPLVVYLEKHRIKRVWAITYVYLVLIVLALVGGFWGVPRLIEQMNQLTQLIPTYVDQVRQLIADLEQAYARVEIPEQVRVAIGNSLLQVENMAIALLSRWLDGVVQLLSHLLDILLIPILAFYFLNDKVYLQQQLWKVVPVSLRGEIRGLCLEIHQVLQGFLQGSVIVGLVVASLTTAGLMMIRMDFALAFGLLAGILNIIPYFGPMIGMIPVAAFALFDSIQLAITAVIIMVMVQQIESNFITPRIIGEKVGVHPVLVIFALLAGGQLWGIWGMVLAIPLSGVIKVILQLIIKKTIQLGENRVV